MSSSFVVGGGVQSDSISDFDPRTISGCVLWLDANDSNTVYSAFSGTFPNATGTTLATNGSNVLLWSDKSGQGNNATQNTSSTISGFTGLNTGIPAVFTTNSNNQNSTLRFGNLGSFRLDPSKIPTGTTPMTVFTVARLQDTSSPVTVLHIGDNIGASRFIRLSTTVGPIFAQGNDGTYPNANNSAVITQNSIISGVVSGGTAASNNFIYTGWSNGTPFANNNPQDRMNLNLSVGTAYVGIGGGSSSGTQGFRGDISEILVFNRALQNDERQQIEGYLAWKWGISQNLPSTHPYYYSKAPQTSFQPTNFPSCALWLDAADTSTVSGIVTQWRDKSGNGRHFGAAGSSPTPTFLPTGFLGSPGLQFTRTSNTSRTVLQWTNSSTPLVTSDITVMMLVRRASVLNTSSDRLLSTTSNITTDADDFNKPDSFAFVNARAGNSVIWRNSNPGVTTPTIIGMAENGFEVITMIINKSSLVSTIRQTVQTGTTTGTRINEPNADLSLRQLRLGTATSVQEGNTDAGTSTFEGVISEVLIYNSVLSTSQLENLEGYLARKYNIVSRILPSSHPYFNTSPVSFQPTSIPGCQLWLDASDISTLSLNVNNVIDKSGRSTSITTVAGDVSNPYPTFDSINKRGIIIPTTTSGNPNYLRIASFSPYGTVSAGTDGQFTMFWASSKMNTTSGGGVISNNLSFTYISSAFSNTQISQTFGVTYINPVFYSNTAQSSVNTLTVLSNTNDLLARQLVGGILTSNFTQIPDIQSSITSTSGSPTVTVVSGSTNAFVPGMNISINGSANIQISSISGTTITLVSNATQSITNSTQYSLSSNVSSTIPSGTYIKTLSAASGSGPYTYTIGLSQNVTISAGNVPLAITSGTNSVTRSYQTMSIPRASFDPTVNAFMTTTNITGSGGSASLSVNGGSVSVSATSPVASNASGSPIDIQLSNGTNLSSYTLYELLMYNVSLSTAQRQQVEGYLAWKWGLQANLSSGHPFLPANYFFNNTRPLTRYFSPPDIEGCQLWLDGADLSTLFTDTDGTTPATPGVTIQRWNDKSGLANNVTNSSSTVRYSNTLNSRPVLSFPSTGTIAGNTLSTASLTRDANNFSAFYVCRYPSGSFTYPVQALGFGLDTTVSTSISGGTNAGTTVLTVSSVSNFRIGSYVIISGVSPAGYNQSGIISAINSGTNTISVDLSVSNPGGTYIFGGTLTQISASQLFGNDGRSTTNYNIQNVNYEAGISTRAISSFAYSTLPTLANNTFLLGCVRQNGVFSLSTNGISHNVTLTNFVATGNKTTGAYSILGGLQGLDVAEVVIYNSALSDGERQIIEGYLAWKWGIQRATSATNPSVSSALTYPTTHPYYSIPPTRYLPLVPSTRLFKKPFDPSDLSPVIWIDPQDSSVVTRDTAGTNRITQITNKGSFVGNFTAPSGMSGPLFTRSSIGNGTGLEFLDFSNGGNYQISSATMDDATTMTLTVFPPHNGNIPVGAFINLFPSRGVYSDNKSATINIGPFQILTASIASLRTLTITTVSAHTIAVNDSVRLTINTGTYSGGATATGLTGDYTAQSGTTGSTIVITLGSDQTNGIMAISDGHVRNNTGTSGPYITQSGTTGSTVKLTSYSSRATGNLVDFMGRIEYGSIPITSGQIGVSTVTLLSVSSSVFTVSASDVTGIALGTPLIPDTTSGGLASGTTYFITSISGSTFRLASSIQNALASSPTTLTFTNNATLNLSVKCYGTRLILRTPIDHNITSNQTINLNINNNFTLPYQAAAPTTDTTLNPCAIEFTSATISGTSPNQVLTINLSTITGRQNPFFALISGVPTYTLRGTFSVRFPNGTQFGDSSSASNISITGLSTSNSANNNATTIEFQLPASPVRPTGNLTFNGLPGVIVTTSGGGASNGGQLNIAVATTSVSGNTIVCPTPIDYPAVTARAVAPNIGSLIAASSVITQYHPSDNSNISASSIIFPLNGYSLENSSLSTALDSSTSTIIFVTHLTNPVYRNSRFGSSLQPTIISTSSTVGGTSGDNATSYRIAAASFAGNAARIVLRHSNAQSSNFPAATQWTDTTNGFRISTAYLNLTSTTVGECLAYSRGITLGGYRYDGAFYNIGSVANATGPTNVSTSNGATGVPVGNVQTGTLSISQIRIGTRTDATSTYSGDNIPNTRWYEGGIGDVLIFNRILPVEERQLLEGFLAQKYRTNGSIGGNAITINATQTYSITGSSAISGSSPNFTITLTGTFTTQFVPGTQITIAGVTTATGLNGTWTLATANTTTVTFQSPTSTNMLWATGNGGTITGFTGTTGNSIHPYRLNPNTVTSSNTLNLTSTTATFSQNLVAWFDASNPNLMNNTNITTQANGSPPGNNTTVAQFAPTSGWWSNTPLQLTNTGGTPTYFSTTAGKTQNGLGGIFFNGSTDALSLNTSTGSFSQYATININSNFTWTVVFRPDSGASATTPVLSVTNGSSNRLMLCSNGTFTYSDGTTTQTLTESAVLTNANTHMITVYRDGNILGYRIVSTDGNIGSSGFLSGTLSVTNLSISSFNNPTLTFGASSVTGFTTSFTGSVFEAALFRSTLTTQAIQQVEGYLAWKWGLQASLPSTHAYKRVAY